MVDIAGYDGSPPSDFRHIPFAALPGQKCDTAHTQPHITFVSLLTPSHHHIVCIVLDSGSTRRQWVFCERGILLREVWHRRSSALSPVHAASSTAKQPACPTTSGFANAPGLAFAQIRCASTASHTDRMQSDILLLPPHRPQELRSPLRYQHFL